MHPSSSHVAPKLAQWAPSNSSSWGAFVRWIEAAIPLGGTCYWPSAGCGRLLAGRLWLHASTRLSTPDACQWCRALQDDSTHKGCLRCAPTWMRLTRESWVAARPQCPFRPCGLAGSTTCAIDTHHILLADRVYSTLFISEKEQMKDIVYDWNVNTDWVTWGRDSDLWAEISKIAKLWMQFQ